jgi:hypothetical protein
MSGGGGNGGGGGGGGDGERVDCASLIFPTILNSPDPEVLAQLNDGDVLNLRRPDPTKTRVEARTAADAIAGTITGGRFADLLVCLERDVAFIAKVVSISNGLCKVEVRPRGG